MYTIAPLSRSGSCLFSNAALIANRITALERPAITVLLRRKAIGNIERAAWGFRQSAALTFGFQNSGQRTQPSNLFPPCRQTRSCLQRLFHSLAVPEPGSSRRGIWNRERHFAPI